MDVELVPSMPVKAGNLCLFTLVEQGLFEGMSSLVLLSFTQWKEKHFDRILCCLLLRTT